jgi:hypothetical protein
MIYSAIAAMIVKDYLSFEPNLNLPENERYNATDF